MSKYYPITRGCGDGRGQLHTAGIIRLLVGTAIAGIVLVIVINEAVLGPSLAVGEVEQVCGLCHVNWRRQGAFLLGVGGLLAVANRLLGRRQPPEEEVDE